MIAAVVEVGSTVGSYQVLSKIGEGAMAAVYLAVHPTIGRKVALKVIHTELATDEESMARFFNEARAVTQIGHPHIVDVYDFGQTPSGESFIVMELLEGMSLGALLRKETSLSIERAVKIAVEICAGLSAAHVRGIIHRDLKPDNIFLIERAGVRDFVKIVDFGLAKLTGPGAVQHKTRTGVLLGTAHYMAPELAEDAKKVDHRIDVYALGCVLFEMIIGRVPFPGDGFGHILVRHIREVPPMPSRLRADVPAWLEKIILHALAKNPAFRFASMDAFALALRDPLKWERAFDEHEPAEHELIQPRTPTPARLAPVPAAPAPVVRAVQLPADAPTMMGPSSVRPSPQPGERILAQATVVHDAVSSNERTTDPRPAVGSTTASVPQHSGQEEVRGPWRDPRRGRRALAGRGRSVLRVDRAHHAQHRDAAAGRGDRRRCHARRGLARRDQAATQPRYGRAHAAEAGLRKRASRATAGA